MPYYLEGSKANMQFSFSRLCQPVAALRFDTRASHSLSPGHPEVTLPAKSPGHTPDKAFIDVWRYVQGSHYTPLLMQFACLSSIWSLVSKYYKSGEMSDQF